MVDWVILSVVVNPSSFIPSLVDKIIISQDSLKAFINTVCPGAYASMTKVNFKSLDQYIIKPVGIYGSKEEIVRFLLELGVADGAVCVDRFVLCIMCQPVSYFFRAAELLDPTSLRKAQRALRSGMYILRHIEQQNNAEQIFVIYWPEESTWDDLATSQVCRNRVTFMRFVPRSNADTQYKHVESASSGTFRRCVIRLSR